MSSDDVKEFIKDGIQSINSEAHPSRPTRIATLPVEVSLTDTHTCNSEIHSKGLKLMPD